MHYCYNTRPLGDSPDPPMRVAHTTIYEPDGSTIVADTVLKQDALAWVAQGPISDRTREHPVTSDRGVLLYHKMLLENAERVERGEDPMGVIRDPAKNWPFIALHGERASGKMIQAGV
jgi:5,5'-dehydrodivanillate O-demethylase